MPVGYPPAPGYDPNYPAQQVPLNQPYAGAQQYPVAAPVNQPYVGAVAQPPYNPNYAVQQYPGQVPVD